MLTQQVTEKTHVKEMSVVIEKSRSIPLLHVCHLRLLLVRRLVVQLRRARSSSLRTTEHEPDRDVVGDRGVVVTARRWCADRTLRRWLHLMSLLGLQLAVRCVGREIKAVHRVARRVRTFSAGGETWVRDHGLATRLGRVRWSRGTHRVHRVGGGLSVGMVVRSRTKVHVGHMDRRCQWRRSKLEDATARKLLVSFVDLLVLRTKDGDLVVLLFDLTRELSDATFQELRVFHPSLPQILLSQSVLFLATSLFLFIVVAARGVGAGSLVVDGRRNGRELVW